MRTVAVVPAAGSAERFGGAKLLAPIEGEPLLERTVSTLLNGGVNEVIVVLGPDGDRFQDRLPALRDTRVQCRMNPQPERGMLSSIQTGVAAAQGDAIVVLPGDMPYVRSGTVATLLDAFARSPGRIVSPRFEGKRGHPVVLPSALRDDVLAAEPTATLHDVLRPHAELRLDVDVADRGVVRDVDTPGDLEAAT